MDEIFFFCGLRFEDLNYSLDLKQKTNFCKNYSEERALMGEDFLSEVKKRKSQQFRIRISLSGVLLSQFLLYHKNKENNLLQFNLKATVFIKSFP